MDTNQIVENRLKSLKTVYDSMDTIIDELGRALPEGVTNTIKKCVLGDEELKTFMHGVENHRTPRIMLLGRTGIGKSSLINALCGGYVAEVNDYRSCTSEIKFYSCKDDGRVLMDIMDSRGFSENKALKDSSAEEDLLSDVIDFAPDAILIVLSCDRRDDSISEDLDFLIKVQKEYFNQYYQQVPIIAVINRADTVPPKREQDPALYSEKKKVGIAKVVSEYRMAFKNKKLRFNDVIAVSSLIDWKLDDGSEEGIPLTVEEIENLTDREKKQIAIDFDGRYQIEELRDIIESSIEDYEAKMGFMMAVKLNDLVLKLAKKLTNIFSGISTTVGASPIPVSDILVLVPLQAALVIMIALLSGREIDIKTAKEFVISLGGVSATGFICRTIAQQGAKAVNLIAPTAGSALSATIAGGGTKAIGEAAIKYYLQDKEFELIKSEFSKKRAA